MSSDLNATPIPQKIPFESSHHSVGGQKVAGFPPESVAAFTAECWPPSPGTPATFGTESWPTWTGFVNEFCYRHPSVEYENTADLSFVIDRHPAADNVWFAGGGSGHGYKHGPAVREGATTEISAIWRSEHIIPTGSYYFETYSDDSQSIRSYK